MCVCYRGWGRGGGDGGEIWLGTCWGTGMRMGRNSEWGMDGDGDRDGGCPVPSEVSLSPLRSFIR